MEEKLKNSIQINIEKAPRSYVSSDGSDGISIKYYFDKTDGRVYAKVTFGPATQGPPGFVHGGALAAALDETMGITAWMNNLQVMTKELKIIFSKALKLGSTVYIEAWIENKNKTAAIIKGKLTAENGETIFTEAEGVFQMLDEKKWKSFGIDADSFISDDYLDEK
ncbi:MAG: PaaI family thioesterase [Chlorobi bacterium]|nr:PaaI family thioesterase [Chlorobiota bacterium]